MANHHNSQRNGSRSGRASAVTAANLNPNNNNNNSNNPNSRRKKPNASTANNPTASNRSNSFKTNKPIVHSSRLKAGRNGATRARPVKPLPTASKATANSRASTSLSSSQKNGPSRPKKTLNSASVNYKQSNCSTVAANVASRSGATVNGQLSLDESDSSPSESSCATSSSTSSFSKDKENRFSVQTSGSQKIAMARPTKSYRRPKAAAKSPLTAVTSPEVPIKRRSAKSRSSKSSADAKSTVQSKSSLVPIAEQSSEPIQTLVMEVTLHENRVPESDLVDSGPSSSSYGYGTSHDPMESGSDSSSDYHHPELEGHYKLDEFGDIDLTHCDPIQEMLLTKNAGKFFALYDNYIIVGIDGYNAFWERVRKLYAEDEPQDLPDTPHSPVNHSQPGPNSPHQSHATQMDDSFSSGDRLFGSVDSDLDTTDLSELI